MLSVVQVPSATKSKAMLLEDQQIVQSTNTHKDRKEREGRDGGGGGGEQTENERTKQRQTTAKGQLPHPSGH